MRKYRVWMRSVPGFYAQYDGSVEVFADSDGDAIEEAYQKLKRSAFPERSRSMWRVIKVELIG